MNCQHKIDEGVCGEVILVDRESYTGFSHELRLNEFGEIIDWLHEAIDTPNSGFVSCEVCGKKGDENEAHITFGGHAFRAVAQ